MNKHKYKKFLVSTLPSDRTSAYRDDGTSWKLYTQIWVVTQVESVSITNWDGCVEPVLAHVVAVLPIGC